MDTPRIKDLIRKGDIDTLKEGMEQGVQEGCQTFDQALFTLYIEGKINLDQAIINADSANNLRLKIKLAGLKDDDETERMQPEAADNQGATKAEPLKGKGANSFRLSRT